MYLSRCEINTARRGAQKLLGSPQAMHAAVMASFPQADVEQMRPLWRVDRLGDRTWLYVVGAREPDFTHVMEQAGWPTRRAWDTREYDGLLSSLRPGDRFAFRLRANPTRSVRPSADKRSQRVGHVTAAQQLQWLVDRAGRWGFELPKSEEGPHVAVASREVLRFRRDGAWVTLAVATFDGELVVTDSAALRRVLVEGAGPAKAYGCGLLTLARATGAD